MFKKILMFLFCCLLQFAEGAGTSGGAVVCNVGFGNTCFVRNGNIGIIIDAGGEDLSDESLDAIGELSQGISKLLIIITHNHNDHVSHIDDVLGVIDSSNPQGFSHMIVAGESDTSGANVWVKLVDGRSGFCTEANANQALYQFVGDDRVKIARSWNYNIRGTCAKEHKDNIIVGIRFDKNDGGHEQLIFMGDACGGDSAQNPVILQGIIWSVVCQDKYINVIRFLVPHHGSDNNGECNWFTALNAIRGGIPVMVYISTKCGQYRGIPSQKYEYRNSILPYSYARAGSRSCTYTTTLAFVTEYWGDLNIVSDPQPPQQPQALSARSAPTKADEAAPCCNHNAGDNPLPAKAEGTTVQR